MKIKHNKYGYTRGSLHPIERSARKIYAFFQSIGLNVVFNPEICSYTDNFLSLNVKDNDFITMQDATFYIEDELLLRSHLSANWTQEIRKHELPLAFIEIGKVYRRDTTGKMFRPVFYQAEIVIIDRGLTLSNLIAVSNSFVDYYFNKSRKCYIRPYWHAFTCPGAIIEVDCLCSDPICRFCGGTKRIPVSTAGMIDANVFSGQKIDSLEVNGIAIGLGPTRLAQIDLGIETVNLLYDSDIKFISL